MITITEKKLKKAQDLLAENHSDLQKIEKMYGRDSEAYSRKLCMCFTIREVLELLTT